MMNPNLKDVETITVNGSDSSLYSFLFTVAKDSIEDTLSTLLRKGDKFSVWFEISDIHLIIHFEVPNSALTQSKHFTIDKLVVLPVEMESELRKENDFSRLMEKITGHFNVRSYVIDSKKIKGQYDANEQRMFFSVVCE